MSVLFVDIEDREILVFDSVSHPYGAPWTIANLLLCAVGQSVPHLQALALCMDKSACGPTERTGMWKGTREVSHKRQPDLQEQMERVMTAVLV